MGYYKVLNNSLARVGARRQNNIHSFIDKDENTNNDAVFAKDDDSGIAIDATASNETSEWTVDTSLNNEFAVANATVSDYSVSISDGLKELKDEIDNIKNTKKKKIKKIRISFSSK